MPRAQVSKPATRKTSPEMEVCEKCWILFLSQKVVTHANLGVVV